MLREKLSLIAQEEHQRKDAEEKDSTWTPRLEQTEANQHQAFPGSFEGQDVLVLVRTDCLQLVTQADTGVILVDCSYRNMRIWEDRSSDQGGVVVITEISGSQNTFYSDQAAEICAAIAQRMCMLL